MELYCCNKVNLYFLLPPIIATIVILVFVLFVTLCKAFWPQEHHKGESFRQKKISVYFPFSEAIMFENHVISLLINARWQSAWILKDVN